jgi:fumarate reductase iron-sulfur subunit
MRERAGDEAAAVSALRTSTLRVFRWSPGEAERWQTHEVTANADTTVLDALVDIQRRADPTLAFRYACRVGMCGSCAMVIDGRERWACRTRLTSLGATVSVRPLYHFPVLRDLVVDMAPFVARFRAVGASMMPAAGAPAYAMVPGDSRERAEIDRAIECIGCGMCVSACTIVAHDPRFPGPAALNRAYTLQIDRRDDGRQARWQILMSEDALARCHGQGNCTEVCPMGLSPTTSILALRRLGVRRLFGVGRP